MIAVLYQTLRLHREGVASQTSFTKGWKSANLFLASKKLKYQLKCQNVLKKKMWNLFFNSEQYHYSFANCAKTIF